jgi:hypothetical protein
LSLSLEEPQNPAKKRSTVFSIKTVSPIAKEKARSLGARKKEEKVNEPHGHLAKQVIHYFYN